MKHLIRWPAVLLALAVSGCGSSTTEFSPANPGNPGGGGGSPEVSTAGRVSGNQIAGKTVQDASNAGEASCAAKRNLTGGTHHPVQLVSAVDGATITFEVIEPMVINCVQGNPLVLHGHGFGGARTQDPAGTILDRLRKNGYAVVSIDQRGFGDSSGTVRVMDPNYEGKDLLQILDWVEQHLDYLSHERRADGSTNLVAGSTGGSYGGMYQLLIHNIDSKHRLDVMTPDITPNDLRFSLNPNNTVKASWALLLVAGGEAGANQPLIGGLDPAIKETLIRGGTFNAIPADALPFFYYHSAKYFLDGAAHAEDPMSFYTGQLGLTQGFDYLFKPTASPAKVDILFTQGFRDTLFDFNDGWRNYNGYKALGGDVRLLTHQSGHILPGTETVLGQLGPLDAGVAQVAAQLQAGGLSLPELQKPSGPATCGSLKKDDMVVAFLNEKLLPPNAETLSAAVLSGLAHLDGSKYDDSLCLSLDDSTALWSTPSAVTGGQTATFTSPTIPVPNSLLGLSSVVQPTFIPLTGITGSRFAGIPHLKATLALPGVPVNGCALAASAPQELPVKGCDAIVLVGIGARSGSAAPRLIDEQLTPLRGLGEHDVDMTGVAEKLADGEQLGLLVYGYHPQYTTSISRDLLVPAVTLAGTVRIPMQ